MSADTLGFRFSSQELLPWRLTQAWPPFPLQVSVDSPNLRTLFSVIFSLTHTSLPSFTSALPKTLTPDTCNLEFCELLGWLLPWELGIHTGDGLTNSFGLVWGIEICMTKKLLSKPNVHLNLGATFYTSLPHQSPQTMVWVIPRSAQNTLMFLQCLSIKIKIPNPTYKITIIWPQQLSTFLSITAT